MIACGNSTCPYKRFHFKCLKLTDPPRYKKWFVLNVRRSFLIVQRKEKEERIVEDCCKYVWLKYVNMFQSDGTTESHTNLLKHNTHTTLSSTGTLPSLDNTKSISCVPLSNVYFCQTLPITRSTWIRIFATRLVCSTSTPVSCKLFFSSCECRRSNTGTVQTYRVLDLSARIVSPGTRWSSRPQFSVKCLSLTRPPHPSEMKHTVPCGVIPIKYFIVLWCL